MRKNVVVVGLGYVGLSYALGLSLKYNVSAIDINEEKVSLLNEGKSPINNEEFKNFIAKNKVPFKSYLKNDGLYEKADYIIIATPTDYDETKNAFNVTSVDSVIEEIKKFNSNAAIIIKSTCPVGYTKSKKLDNLYFSPEFLREHKPISDILSPDRIIIGGTKREDIVTLLKSICNNDPEILFTASDEAEAIKLFSNTYLAMRVAFFNEVDTFAIEKNLNVKNLIKGISLDKRIGQYYNNPSFGYGGYCLPKDTKELKEDFNQIPSALISSIVLANDKRKEYVIKDIENRVIDKNNIIGIYRLSMKANSENFRFSSMLDVINGLKKDDYNIMIYEPSIKDDFYNSIPVINDLDLFKNKVDFIVANRIDDGLDDCLKPIYSRDLFNKD